MTIESEEIELMKKLFWDPNCSIKNLEMEELEVSESKSISLMESVMKLKHLYTFDFSQNNMTREMARGIVQMINQYQMLEILCLDRCELNDSLFMTIFHGLPNSKL